MNKALLNLGMLLLMMWGALVTATGQTTITTTGTPAYWSVSSSTIVFGVRNNNPYPVLITDLGNYTPASYSTTFTLWYHPTIVTGVPSAISAANGWIQLPVSYTIPTTSSAGIKPLFSGINLTLPGNTIYRLALVASASGPYYGSSGSTGNIFSGGGVDILAQNNPASPTYVGYFPGPPNNTPRTFYGTITFKPASDNDISGVAVVQPVNNSQHCPAPIMVRAAIKNTGTQPQSNFPVDAYFTGPVNGSLSTTYSGTLASGAVDTVDFPLHNFQPGTYNIYAAPALSTDTISNNDTTPVAIFTVKQPTPVPTVISDTVCAGGNAFLSVAAMPNTTYQWYSAATGGTLVNISNNLTFNNLLQDTIMYVSALLNGCESGRTQIQAIIGPPPVVDLGPDTSFCESLPLILDAGNPGGSYTWSTGDTVQSLSLTNQSGIFWVTVDKYCLASDTVAVAIAPRPYVSGISYVRMNNTYKFSPSGEQHVVNYLWIFGDGATSTLRVPTHTYGLGHTEALNVQLIVSNDCGTDSAFRFVPTGVDNIHQEDQTLTLYPNPATNELVIGSALAVLQEVAIVDITGRTVLKQKVAGVSSHTFDVSQLANGHYIVHGITDMGRFSRKLEVRR